jgi:hypothetical protein
LGATRLGTSRIVSIAKSEQGSGYWFLKRGENQNEIK